MQLRHVLAVVDFSTDAGIHAAWRAAHLAWAHDADLCLFTQVDLPDGSPSSKFGATAPPARARADLLHLAGDIRDLLNIRPAVIVGVGADGQETLRACTRRANLVAMPGSRKLAQRMVTEHGVPVLLTRCPPTSAHRSAMLIHEAGISNLAALLGVAQWLCKPDGIRAFTLLDRRRVRHLQAADQPLPTVQAFGQLAHHRAQNDLSAELTRAGLRPDQGTVLTHTSAARLAQEQMRSGASVIVVGKRRQPPWMDLFWPGLARQVSDRVGCDTLFVPDRMPTAKDARGSLGEHLRKALPPAAARPEPPGSPG